MGNPAPKRRQYWDKIGCLYMGNSTSEKRQYLDKRLYLARIWEILNQK
jgi:hypothetical protein